MKQNRATNLKISQMLQILEEYYRANIQYCDAIINPETNEITLSPSYDKYLSPAKQISAPREQEKINDIYDLDIKI